MENHFNGPNEKSQFESLPRHREGSGIVAHASAAAGLKDARGVVQDLILSIGQMLLSGKDLYNLYHNWELFFFSKLWLVIICRARDLFIYIFELDAILYILKSAAIW